MKKGIYFSSLMVIILVMIVFLIQISSFSLSETINNVNTTSNVTVELTSNPSGWDNLTAPEGVFEPYNSSLTGTHFNTFYVNFTNITMQSAENLVCFIRESNGDFLIFNETGNYFNGVNYSISYTVTNSDSIIKDSVIGYIPWILKNCSIYSAGGALLKNETVNKRIYVHFPLYWSDEEITRAVTCQGTPGVYFNNSAKCGFLGDTMFALQMRNGNPVEEDCFINPGTGCGNDYCKGIFFPSCNALNYFAGYSAFTDDPNGYATFTVSFSGYNVPVAYSRYTNSNGNFKLRATQTLSNKPFSFTIYNLTNVDSANTNVYGPSNNIGTLKVTDMGDGTFTVAYYNFSSYSGDIDFVFNISFTNNSMDEEDNLSFIIAFGTSTNQGNPEIFPETFSTTFGFENNNESENTSAANDTGGRCGDRVNNDFNYIGAGGSWSNSYDCYDSNCDGFLGDYNQVNEFYPFGGITGICNYNIETNCTDGFDNNYVNYTDCHDIDCFHVDPACPTNELNCSDGINNDWDYVDTETEQSHKIGDNGWNGLKYEIGRTSNLTDCEDPDCDGLTGETTSGALCNWGYETDCSDGFNNDALQMKDCELATMANTRDMPTIASAEYDCSTWCRTNILSSETGTLCEDNLDNDFDAITVVDYYSGTLDTSFNSGIDCRWGGYFGIGSDYRPDGDCNMTAMSTATCELAREITCNDSFDNDFDHDAVGMPHANWSLDSVAYQNYFGQTFVNYGDYDDYDCAGRDLAPTNESLNSSWCFDGIDDDLDEYYFDGTNYTRNSSTGTDCADPDCFGVVNPGNPSQVCLHKEYDPTDPFFTGLAIPGIFCNNSFDDDANAYLGWPLGGTDCEDPNCNKMFTMCTGPCYDQEDVRWNSCANNIDDDFDMPTQIIDCEDTSCSGMIGNESGALCQSVETYCDDGLDNDGNGLTDCQDPTCMNIIGGKIDNVNVYCRTEENSSQDCFDGFDNDANGYIDCYDSSCNYYCGLSTINGNTPLTLPVWSDLVNLNDVSNAFIVNYTTIVRNDEWYNITFEMTGASTNAQWTIGTANARFNKDSFDASTAYLTGPNSGSFSLSQTSNGFIIDSNHASLPAGYVVSFLIKSNDTLSSYDYELTYAEEVSSVTSLNNYFAQEVVENISPTAQVIQVIPDNGKINYGGKVYVRGNITDNYGIGLCEWKIYGADSFNLTDSTQCRGEFSPTIEGTYYINLTPKDYYSNLGTTLTETYSLDIMPSPTSTTLDKSTPFYNSSDVSDLVTINASFDVLATDTLGNCELIAKNNVSEFSIANFSATGDNCYSSGISVSSLADGEYQLFARVTETTEGDIIESNPTALFVCAGRNGLCEFAEYLGTGRPDVCSIVENVTVTLIRPVDADNLASNIVEFNCSANSTSDLENITLYVWNTTEVYRNTKQITGTNNYSNWTTTLNLGNYTWNCLAYNNLSEYSFAENNRTFGINVSEDTTGPEIELVSPDDNYRTTRKTITFEYRATDANSILNCSLIIDTEVKSTLTNVTNNTLQSVTLDLDVNIHEWQVRCYDEFNNLGTSATRELTISTTGGGGGGTVNQTIPGGTGEGAAIQTFKKCFDEINNQQIIIEPKDKDLGVEKISFFYDGYAKGPCVIIKEIKAADLEKINYSTIDFYKGFAIETENLEKGKILNIEILNSVINGWFELRDIKTFLLNENKELKLDGWIYLPMKFTSQEQGYTFFSTSVPEFSIFLIKAQLRQPAICGNNVCEAEKGETSENCPEDCKEGCSFLGISGGLFGICWYWWIIIALLIITIILLYIKSYKNNNRNYNRNY